MIERLAAPIVEGPPLRLRFAAVIAEKIREQLMQAGALRVPAYKRRERSDATLRRRVLLQPLRVLRPDLHDFPRDDDAGGGLGGALLPEQPVAELQRRDAILAVVVDDRL